MLSITHLEKCGCSSVKLSENLNLRGDIKDRPAEENELVDTEADTA